MDDRQSPGKRFAQTIKRDIPRSANVFQHSNFGGWNSNDGGLPLKEHLPHVHEVLTESALDNPTANATLSDPVLSDNIQRHRNPATEDGRKSPKMAYRNSTSPGRTWLHSSPKGGGWMKSINCRPTLVAWVLLNRNKARVRFRSLLSMCALYP